MKAGALLTVSGALSLTGNDDPRSDGTTLLKIEAGTIDLTAAIAADHATDEVQIGPTCQATGSGGETCKVLLGATTSTTVFSLKEDLRTRNDPTSWMVLI